MTTLTLENLNKEYLSGEAAVVDLSLKIKAGELMVLLGPSGCGKTTTLRLIAGLLQPSSGDVLFDDVSVLDLPPERRGAVMVFQEHTLFPFMSVGENVAYAYSSARSLVNAWINSDSHRQNIEGDYTDFEVSAEQNKEGKWYYTNMFIKR